MEMGQILLAYIVFMTEVFVLLTSVSSVGTALWIFAAVYAGCVFGTLLWVWWEEGRHMFTRMQSVGDGARE
jgi:hypothetical protein